MDERNDIGTATETPKTVFSSTETGFEAERREGDNRVKYSYTMKDDEMFVQTEFYKDEKLLNDSSERIQLTEDGRKVLNSEHETVEEFCRADFEELSEVEIDDIDDIIKTRTNSETVEAFKHERFRERAEKYWSNDWWRDIPVAEEEWARIQEHPLRGVARYTKEPPEKIETVIRSYGDVGNYTTNIPSEFAIYLGIVGGEKIVVALECRDEHDEMVIVLRKASQQYEHGREVSTQASGPHGNQVRFFMPKGIADALDLDGRKLTWRMENDSIVIVPGQKVD